MRHYGTGRTTKGKVQIEQILSVSHFVLTALPQNQ